MAHVHQGVIHGKTLQLTDDPGFGDGEPVEVVIRSLSTAAEAGKSAAGMLAGVPGTDDDLDELYRYRHSGNWREVEP
jgi:hypothetical protein